MKKMIVDCSKPLGEQETIVDVVGEEKEAMLAASALAAAEAVKPKPKTLEEQLADLAAEVEALKSAAK